MTSSYTVKPSLAEYKKLANQGNLIPVYAEILADLETPVSAFARIFNHDYAFLLESVEGGEKWARYSFLGADPKVVFRSKGQRAEIIRGERADVVEGFPDALHALKQLLAEYKPVEIEGLPRFIGGAVGYIGYDMIRYFERMPDQTIDELGCYDTHFIITDTIIVFDNVRHTMKVVVNSLLEDGRLPEAVYEEAVEKIGELIGRLSEPVRIEPPREYEEALEYRSNFTRDQYQEVVTRCKEYIRQGDIIQVVPSQRFRAPAKVDPLHLYRALRRINPSPYMFFLKLGAEQLIGSSPEVLIRVEGDQAELRPIAGTRPRGKDPDDDL